MQLNRLAQVSSPRHCFVAAACGCGGTLRQPKLRWAAAAAAQARPPQQQQQQQLQHHQQQRRRHSCTTCEASKKEAVLSPAFLTENPIGKALSGVVGTPLFVALEVVSLLVILALTDAAYSGDWSRIGVIPKDVEPLLQKITIIAWALHGVCGYAASNTARSKGRSAASAAVKGVLFGSLHVFEELVLPGAEAAQQQQQAASKRGGSSSQKRR